MMSLSKEWALLSRAMYGQAFIDELFNFLQNRGVKTILECGCGDGYILQGLAKKGLQGTGIDASPEMIALALEKHKHPNIIYREMNWLDLESLESQFDGVMCRGNSLSYVVSWDKQEINPKQARSKIEESVRLFFQRLKKGGLLYLDTISQAELEKNGRSIEITLDNIYLKGRIEYDWQRRIRKTFGNGRLGNEEFSGSAISYILTPDELEGIVKILNPSVVWRPKLVNEVNYEVICAVK